jgi:hypothetical protein
MSKAPVDARLLPQQLMPNSTPDVQAGAHVREPLIPALAGGGRVVTIMHFDGNKAARPWAGAGELELTLTKKPGDTVSIEYTRAGQSATATVTLAAQP